MTDLIKDLIDSIEWNDDEDTFYYDLESEEQREKFIIILKNYGCLKVVV